MNFKLPNTRYSGSKRKLVHQIWNELISLDIEFDTVLDVFGGTGSFSYFAKLHGKQVTYNDIFKFNYLIGKAIIENNELELTKSELESLLVRKDGRLYKDIVEKNYKDIYYTDCENRQIDIVVQNIEDLDTLSKKASAYYILFQSCLIKRPYNLFHRKNLNLRTNFNGGRFGNKISWERSFAELFDRFYKELKEFCFSNSRNNVAINESALNCKLPVDLVYIDPPYFTNKSHVTYHSKYHFLEGIANYDILDNSMNTLKKHKEITINSSDEFENKHNFIDDLSKLISSYRKSIVVISYRGNGFPSIDAIANLLKQQKGNARIIDLGKYSYALNRSNSLNNEYLIVAI